MTAETTQVESEFSIFSRFSGAFSHVVRGDLSVITNEISYLATKMPSEELGRVRNRCSQIAATVSKIAGLRSEVSLSPGSADAIVRAFGAALPLEAPEFIAIDTVKLERLASSLRQILPSGDAAWRAEMREGDAVLLSLYLPFYKGLGGQYGSWSSFASKELGERSVVDAVVADLISRAHGWTVAIDSRDGLRCVMRLPLVALEHLESRRA